MAKVIHQGGAAAEVDDAFVEALLATGEWEVAGAPAPVRRTRKPKVEEAPATEE